MTIREAIKTAIEKKNLSKKKISEELGINYQQFCNYLIGKQTLSGRYFDPLFERLGIEIQLPVVRDKETEAIMLSNLCFNEIKRMRESNNNVPLNGTSKEMLIMCACVGKGQLVSEITNE